jgi:pentatricopeptide repeat protein
MMMMPNEKACKDASIGVNHNIVRSSKLHDTFDSLIKGCAHTGDIDRAERLLAMMAEGNQAPSLSNFNAIVHVCTQAGDVERAKVYLRHMEDMGLNPDTVTYNLVINSCACQNDAEEAEKWLMHMIRRGLKPNEVTYGTICKVLARHGAVERIEEIMMQLEVTGATLNEYFYASLISSCGACNPPNLLRAEKALWELIARGLRPKSVKRALARVLGERRTQQLFVALELRAYEMKRDSESGQRKRDFKKGNQRQMMSPAGMAAGKPYAPPQTMFPWPDQEAEMPTRNALFRAQPERQLERHSGMMLNGSERERQPDRNGGMVPSGVNYAQSTKYSSERSGNSSQYSSERPTWGVGDHNQGAWTPPEAQSPGSYNEDPASKMIKADLEAKLASAIAMYGDVLMPSGLLRQAAGMGSEDAAVPRCRLICSV